MTNFTNFAEYWSDLESTASDIVETARRSNLGSIVGLDDCEQAIWEAADSICVYYSTCSDIVRLSDNRDYGTENGLVEPSDDLNQLEQGLAFYAYWVDLTEHVANQLDDIEQEDWEPLTIRVVEQYILANGLDRVPFDTLLERIAPTVAICEHFQIVGV